MQGSENTLPEGLGSTRGIVPANDGNARQSELTINGVPLSFTFPGAYFPYTPPTQPPIPTASTSEEQKGGQAVPSHQDLRTRIEGMTSASVAAFLKDAPSQSADPAGYALWVHLIQLKTKALELEIADARRREREAEVELQRLRSGSGVNVAPSSSGLQDGSLASPMAPPNPIGGAAPSSSGILDLQAFSGYPLNTASQSNFQVPKAAPSAMLSQDSTQFDFDAMLQYGDLSALLDSMPGTMDPVALLPTLDNPLQPGFTDSAPFPSLEISQVFGDPDTAEEPSASATPLKRRASSLDSSASTPHVKKVAKRNEKKTLLEQPDSCSTCGKSLGRMMLRTPKSQTPEYVTSQMRCMTCLPVEVPPVTVDTAFVGGILGTVEARKRARPAIEQEDESGTGPLRLFCDVCQRVFASGSITDENGERLIGMAEMVCDSCDSKYQRCTDCGGGGGPRIGIGKWRMKQLFQAGRKTCSLNHSRIGDRPREIAVHVTPTDFSQEQREQILEKCKALWTEKTFARLAVPDMLEIDLPPHVLNPLRSFADVETLVNRNWPIRSQMIKAEGIDTNQFVRILGLTWAHTKPRRSVRTVDLEGEYQRSAKVEENQDNSTVLANIKRTKVVIPAGSELIGMWGGEWDMFHGSILVSTFVPFEGTDGEDSTALLVGELVTKVQLLQQSINAKRIEEAKLAGKQPDLLPVPEHLWTVSAGSIPLLRERMADILVRKRSFVKVDEYLTRHPDFIHALEARPLGLHPTKFDAYANQPEADRPKPLVLVRWLGKDFDAQRILEIKQKEFGGKVKLKKRPKSRI